MKSRSLASLLVLAGGVTGCGETPPPTSAKATKPVAQKKDLKLPEAGYDPKADPQTDLQASLKKAQAEDKHILLKVGGNWCIWCRIMTKFLHETAPIQSLLEKHYVLQRVNVSKDNKNEAFLAKFPKIKGYPHLLVLDAQGKLLHSQDTSLLESGQGYDTQKFEKFLVNWSPRNNRP